MAYDIFRLNRNDLGLEHCKFGDLQTDDVIFVHCDMARIQSINNNIAYVIDSAGNRINCSEQDIDRLGPFYPEDVKTPDATQTQLLPGIVRWSKFRSIKNKSYIVTVSEYTSGIRVLQILADPDEINSCIYVELQVDNDPDTCLPKSIRAIPHIDSSLPSHKISQIIAVLNEALCVTKDIQSVFIDNWDTVGKVLDDITALSENTNAQNNDNSDDFENDCGYYIVFFRPNDTHIEYACDRDAMLQQVQELIALNHANPEREILVFPESAELDVQQL